MEISVTAAAAGRREAADDAGEFDYEAAVDEFHALLDELQALEGSERRATLAAWVRSSMFSACGFLLEGWQGKLHREAWAYHVADLDAPTAGKAWQTADYRAGRETIARLLAAEDFENAFYATFPFRMIWTQEDEPWIAGAVGCPPVLEPEKAVAWEHLDIRAVILWNPATGETRLHGEAPRTSHIVLPEPAPDELEVWADTGAFFAAWARRRAGFLSMKAHGLPEDPDGHLPGGLLIGDLDRLRWPLHASRALIPHPPLSRPALRDLVLRSANLPRIEAAGGHG